MCVKTDGSAYQYKATLSVVPAVMTSNHRPNIFLSFVFILTSKMPVRCMEDQDLVGEKDGRGKALSANVERSAGKLS